MREPNGTPKSSGRRTAVDLYCGAGGTSTGAAQAGIDVRYGLDYDKNAVASFAANHPDAYGDCRDVAAVTGKEILELAQTDRIDYLLSGPNCQAVSTMGLFYDADPRNLLFVHLARLVEEFRKLGAAPRNVIIENVPGIAFQRNVRYIRELFGFFIDRGYRCGADVVNFAAWGLPQLRHRFVLLATLEDSVPSFPAPFADVETGHRVVTAWEAISDLASVSVTTLGETAKRVVPLDELTEYQKSLAHDCPIIHNHHVGRTAPIDLARIRTVPQGGSWKDIPPDLIPERFRKVRFTDYMTLFGRIREDHPAYTLSASFSNVTSGCFTHPREDRPLTVREGCRIQGFPDTFVVHGPIPSQYRQIGNAVPPLGAQRLIEHWQGVLEGRQSAGVAPRLDVDLVFDQSGRKFPVLTPRYQRGEYGSGTYWPAGWGPRPKSLPNAEAGYRIATDPITYRREGWRKNRGKAVGTYVEEMHHTAWSDLLRSTVLGEGEALVFEAATQAADEQGQGANDHFLSVLAPIAAGVAYLARKHRRVAVACDFGLTADWLCSLLVAHAQAEDYSLRVIGPEGKATGPDSPHSTVAVSVGFDSLPSDGRVVALVAPFEHVNHGYKDSRNGQAAIPTASEHVRVRQVTLRARSARRSMTPRQLSLTEALTS
jgi:DNA (cytosine-5)-methyltransferase 1